MPSAPHSALSIETSHAIQRGSPIRPRGIPTTPTAPLHTPRRPTFQRTPTDKLTSSSSPASRFPSALGLGLSASLLCGLFLLALLSPTGSTELNLSQRSSRSARVQPAPASQPAMAAANVFVAERIRHEHHQTRFEMPQHDENAHVGPIEDEDEDAAATEASAKVEEVRAEDEGELQAALAEDEADENEALEALVEGGVRQGVAELDSAQVGESDEARVALAVGDKVTQAEGAERPMQVCKKSFTFILANRHGFGSEVALLIRAAAVARHFGYKNLFIDDTDWNFGKWTDYFDPIVNDCLPPSAASPQPIEPKPMTLLRTDWRHTDRAPKYTKSDHLVWSHRDMDGLDATFSAIFVSKKGLIRLQQEDKAKWIAAKQAQQQGQEQHVFGAGEEVEEVQHLLAKEDGLVPRVFRQAYAVQRAVLLDIWKPNPHLLAMMHTLKSELAISHSQQEQHELSTAQDVVIAVHCRLGDKHRELSHLLPPSIGQRPNEKPGLHTGLLNAFYNAASSTVDSILSPHAHAHAPAKRWAGKPTLAIMSDDVGAVARFETHKAAAKWSVKTTTQTAKEEKLLERNKGGFRETAFNHLPIGARVAMAQKFVSDLTTLAQQSDGIVLTASSNVGRLMSLLAGEEKAIEGGRVKSLDTRWFPTANFL